MGTYVYQKLRAAENNNRGLLAEVDAGQHYGGDLWGVFTGLFGLASNELILVSYEDIESRAPTISAHAVEHELWQATAKPLEFTPCRESGLYVFRRFHVAAQDVEEVVQLSSQAWQTFAGAQDYAALPLGLFRPSEDDQGTVKMMLLTWYDSFASWQISRRPAPEAAQNFARRHALTQTTYAIATQLHCAPLRAPETSS